MTKKMAAGGRASSFRDMTAGSGSGLGRLQKTSIAAKTKTQKLKVGGKVEGYGAGGPMTMDEIIAANQKLNPNFKMNPAYEARARLEMEREAADTSPERLAYNARQEKREAAAAAARKKAAARKAMSVSRDAGGGKRGDMGSVGTTMKSNPSIFDQRLDNFALREAAAKIQGNSERMIADELAERLGSESGKPNVPNPKEGMRRGGMTKMAKGGKAEAFEGTARDMAEDKKLAKKYGMSKKAYEKSEIDAKHDKQRSMKGLKMGGKAKMAKGGGVPLPTPVARDRMIPGRGTPFTTNPRMRPPGMMDGGKAGYAAGGMSTAQDGMKGALRPKPTAMAKGGKAEMHDKGCKCMACGGKVKYAKGGKITFGSMKPLPGTKTVGPMRPTTATGASMKKDGMKGQLRAKASGAKPTSMMKPLGMTKMAKGGKVRGAGVAQRGTKFIGEV